MKTKGLFKETQYLLGTSVLLLVVLPLFMKERYVLHLLIIVFMWITLSQSWNLLGGYTGQVSFGHAAFFGLGAYAGGLVYYHFDISSWYGMALGPALSVLIGLPMGIICFRLRGAYFALSMLALAEVLRLVAANWVEVTNGMVGILVMPKASKIPYYYLSLIMAVVTSYGVYRLMRSRWGYCFLAIREDQDAAESIGVNTTLYKNIALGVSAIPSGMAGAFYLNYMGFIDPEIVFSLIDISIMMIMVVMLGGAGTILGPIVGSFIMVLFQEVFRVYFGQANMLAFGILIILTIVFIPDGLVEGMRKYRQKRKQMSDA
ncbi:MAG: branched-chain amino acid ABC transporter permease [Thermodesulfobacteriota bacterium]|nr:branched-chain amino acid ABC transporter permease [Thermodesulfobacteriota bacterium]